MLSMDDLMAPPPPTDTIYVSGLPKDVTDAEISKYFGTIGVLKKHKETGKDQIYLYKDEAGELKGDGKIQFDDPYAAGSAVELYHNKEFKGNKLHVSLAQKKNPDGTYSEQVWDKTAKYDDRPRYNYDDDGGYGGRGRGRGGRGGGRGFGGGGGGYGDRGGGRGGGRGGYGDRGYGDRDRYGGGGGGRSDYGDRDRDRGREGRGGYGGRGYGGGGGGYGGGDGGYGGGRSHGGGGGGYGDRGGGYGGRGGGGGGGGGYGRY